MAPAAEWFPVGVPLAQEAGALRLGGRAPSPGRTARTASAVGSCRTIRLCDGIVSPRGFLLQLAPTNATTALNLSALAVCKRIQLDNYANLMSWSIATLVSAALR